MVMGLSRLRLDKVGQNWPKLASGAEFVLFRPEHVSVDFSGAWFGLVEFFTGADTFRGCRILRGCDRWRVTLATKTVASSRAWLS